MHGIAWRWQSIDDVLMKAPLAGQSGGPNPTDPGKKGSKRQLLVDGRGVPLPTIVTAANANDGRWLDDVLDAIVVKRPQPPQRRHKRPCGRSRLPRAENVIMTNVPVAGIFRTLLCWDVSHAACVRPPTRTTKHN